MKSKVKPNLKVVPTPPPVRESQADYMLRRYGATLYPGPDIRPVRQKDKAKRRKKSHPTKGIEQDFSSREKMMHRARHYYSEHMKEEVDSVKFRKARSQILEFMKENALACAVIIKEIREYKPVYYNLLYRKYLPLTALVVEQRKQDRAARAQAYLDEKTRNRARREAMQRTEVDIED